MLYFTRLHKHSYRTISPRSWCVDLFLSLKTTGGGGKVSKDKVKREDKTPARWKQSTWLPQIGRTVTSRGKGRGHLSLKDLWEVFWSGALAVNSLRRSMGSYEYLSARRDSNTIIPLCWGPESRLWAPRGPRMDRALFSLQGRNSRRSVTTTHTHTHTYKNTLNTHTVKHPQ